MTTKRALMTGLALLVAMSFVGGSTAQAASREAAQRRAFLKLLAIGVPVPLPNPAPVLTPQQIRQLDRNVAKFGVLKPPPIYSVIRKASQRQIAAQRAIILERYRQLALRQGGTAFGGVFPPGGTSYIPTQPINIVSYFPVFRV